MTTDAAMMVTTSLKIPAVDNVTTEVRCKSANSAAVIRNAMHPGNNRKQGVRKTPNSLLNSAKPPNRGMNPSTGIARLSNVRNMTGVSKKMLEKGFEVAGCRSNKIWVRPHRKPEKKAAEMTSTKPPTWNWTSPKTMST